MPFDLTLTFTGMILYVPELTQLQLLMPKTPEILPPPVILPEGQSCGSNGDCMEAHSARITFDTSYMRQGAQTLDGVTAHVSLRGKKLDVPAVGSAYVRGVPQEITRLSSPTRADVLDGTANSELAARVRVRTGRATYADPGECWEYQGTVRRMSHQVEWTISGIDQDHIELPLIDLGGLAPDTSLPWLYPVNGRIELWIWHAPPAELPPDALVPELPPSGSQGHHFSHLRSLLDSRTLEAPLFRPNACGPLPEGTRLRERDKGASSLSCTGGQAPVDP
ncbi:MAG TPA: hypothetical protein VFJ82_08250 [Longimicrobium sp.]|nr:hypothetical protein [Longimicrobium sp.]